MRLNCAATNVATTAMLSMLMVGSAVAAEGAFSYQYHQEDAVQRAAVLDPESNQCLSLPMREHASHVYNVVNHTDSTALVFAGQQCGGPMFILGPGMAAPPDLMAKSVVFTD